MDKADFRKGTILKRTPGVEKLGMKGDYAEERESISPKGLSLGIHYYEGSLEKRKRTRA